MRSGLVGPVGKLVDGWLDPVWKRWRAAARGRPDRRSRRAVTGKEEASRRLRHQRASRRRRRTACPQRGPSISSPLHAEQECHARPTQRSIEIPRALASPWSWAAAACAASPRWASPSGWPRGHPPRPDCGLQFGRAVRRHASPWACTAQRRCAWPPRCGRPSSRSSAAGVPMLQMMAPRLAGFGDGFAMRDDRLIAQRITDAFGDVRLEQLPTPLRVAATDAATGAPGGADARPRGRRAAREHGACPFIFPSVEIDGRRLVDGVLSDPLAARRGAAMPAWCIALGFAARCRAASTACRAWWRRPAPR